MIRIQLFAHKILLAQVQTHSRQTIVLGVFLCHFVSAVNVRLNDINTIPSVVRVG